VDDFSMGRAYHVHHPVDNKERQIWMWHRRLGHPSFGYMKYLFPSLFTNKSMIDLTCDTCILAKSHRTTYPLSMNKSNIPFALVHSDVWGPSPVSTISGIRWFVIFIDDCTRMTWLYLLKNKSDVLSVFQSFHTMVQTQFSAKIQTLRSDNGGEFKNHQFQAYTQSHGLIHETSCPHTPQQNGVAERKNRHILETARALLLGAHMPSRFWTDAVATAVHLLNRMPSRVLDFTTPLHTLSTYFPLPTMLMIPPMVFGCVVFVHLPKHQRTKLDPCAIRCLFLGYAIHQKGYRCYDPAQNRTYVTMDVTFLETKSFFPSPVPTSPRQGEIQGDEPNWLKFDWPGFTEANVQENEEVNEEPHIGSDNEEPHIGSDMSRADEDIPPLTPVPADPSPENIPEVNSSTMPINSNTMDIPVVGYTLPFRHNRG